MRLRDGRSGGPNWYAYVNNDPVNFVDPWGLTPSDAMAAAISYAVALGLAEYWAGLEHARGLGARITQDDPSIAVWYGGENMMATQGCFFLSCLGVAQTATDTTLTAEQIHDVISTTRASGALRGDMAVQPGRGVDIVSAALAEAGSPLAAVDARGTVADPGDASLVRGIVESGSQHWREGDAHGTVPWDPYPGLRFLSGREHDMYVYFRFVQGQ